MRVLLSEGSSTSAREALTILGLHGHDVEICDPDPLCLARFSRLVRRFHRCPGLRDDPLGYLAFIEELIAREHFDALIPIHEQGYVLAAAAGRLRAHTGIALPSFTGYRDALRKAGFSRLLAELGLAQPPTRILDSPRGLDGIDALPCMIKASIGTASRGTWCVADREELARVRGLLEADGVDELLVQDRVDGPIERAQAVFSGGSLLAMHAYRQLRAGAGGGDALKVSVDRPDVRAHLARLGERLGWHGALSVDYICAPGSDAPLYIDCNPRLVEPMNAYVSGLDLVEPLVRVSCGAAIGDVGASQPGARTHLGMQVLLGRAGAGATRRDLLRELRQLRAGSGDYAGSREELTPVRLDWPSAGPLVTTALVLLICPRWSSRLAHRFGAHLLTARTARLIDREAMR